MPQRLFYSLLIQTPEEKPLLKRPPEPLIVKEPVEQYTPLVKGETVNKQELKFL